MDTTEDPMTEMAEAAKAGITVDQYRARKARRARRWAANRAAIESTHRAFPIQEDAETAAEPEDEWE